jgi:hypothetical protein
MVSWVPPAAAGEQPDPQVTLQRGEAFRDCLLADTEVGGGQLELPFVRDGDERPDRFQVHALLFLRRPKAFTTNAFAQPVVVYYQQTVV